MRWCSWWFLFIGSQCGFIVVDVIFHMGPWDQNLVTIVPQAPSIRSHFILFEVKNHLMTVEEALVE
jgi:hypothetical protein